MTYESLEPQGQFSFFFLGGGGGGRGRGFREGLGFRVLGFRAGPLQLLQQDTLLRFGVVITVNRVLGKYFSFRCKWLYIRLRWNSSSTLLKKISTTPKIQKPPRLFRRDALRGDQGGGPWLRTSGFWAFAVGVFFLGPKP